VSVTVFKTEFSVEQNAAVKIQLEAPA